MITYPEQVDKHLDGFRSLCCKRQFTFHNFMMDAFGPTDVHNLVHT